MVSTSLAGKSNAGQQNVPEFVKAINADYQAQISHTFILHGNIYDFCDNGGGDPLSLKKVLTTCYDDHIQSGLGKKETSDTAEAGLQSKSTQSKKTRIVAFYNLSSGLEFPCEKSLEAFIAAHRAVFGDQVMEDWGDRWHLPKNPDQTMAVLNRWFHVSKTLTKQNMVNRHQGKPQSTELVLTLVITDADTLFPQGEIAQLHADRGPIVNLRAWSKDEFVGYRNRIILLTRTLSDIHESIRSELAVSHLVRKPNLEDRLAWLTNFDKSTQVQAAAQGGSFCIGENKNVTGLVFADGFDVRQFATQAAGMNRQQMKDVVLESWRKNQPIDFTLVRTRKQRVMADEFGGILDFREPEFGFEQVGGHDHFKLYCHRKIITPLKNGDKRLCSRGVLMTGPPGTGKSMVAWALAKEAQMNFMQVDLSKVFAGLLGETESNMRKLLEAIEAASPCIVFADEIDSVLSSGRQSSGDGGTSGRVFNAWMSWLSDPGRVGRVVVLAASNRPDLLDAALIRAGRMDAKIPILPPAKGDAAGRKSILLALKKKHRVTFNKALEPTESDPNNGLGRLLLDDQRIWTGAEIEVLVKEALDNAAFSERKRKDGSKDLTIQLDDWNKSMDDVLPGTAEIEKMTDLALMFTDNLAYTPAGYREIAKNKHALRIKLGFDVDDTAA